MSKATVIKICAKCSDQFGATFHDEKGEQVGSYEGYVPDFFPGEHWGDYVELDIDLATGKILNWEPPKTHEINDLIKEGT